MTTIQIAAAGGAANLLFGLCEGMPLCLAIGVAIGLAVWHEYRRPQS